MIAPEHNTEPWCEIIRKFRKRLELNQEEFSVYVGVSKATVVRWEKGVSKPQNVIYKHIMELAKSQRDYKTSNLVQKITPRPGISRTPTAERVFQARLRSQLSQDQFAQKVGVSPRTVQRWESGRSTPSNIIFSIILDIFNNRPNLALQANSIN